MRIRKGDTVLVTAGKDRGKKGRVMRVFPVEHRVLVETVNYRTAYLRKSQENPQGGIAKVEGKIDISNVKMICPRTSKPTRVGYTFLADGTKHRICKSSKEILLGENGCSRNPSTQAL